MRAIFPIVSEAVAMDEKTFQGEAAFQAVMHIAKSMLCQKLLTEREYKEFEAEMVRKYHPFSGCFLT